MSELGFGIVWTVFMAIFTLVFVSAGEGLNISLALFLALFWAIGIFMIVKGIKKVKTNRNTEKLGEECYGMVNRIYPTGTRVNNRPEWQAEFVVYIPSKDSIEYISEVIGFDRRKYLPRSFVKCKYYNGDINILKKVNEAQLPLNIKSYFEPYMNNSNSTVDDIITVNGIRYKRIDDENNQNK